MDDGYGQYHVGLAWMKFVFLKALRKSFFSLLLILFSPFCFASTPIFLSFPYSNVHQSEFITQIVSTDELGVWILNQNGKVSYFDGNDFYHLDEFIELNDIKINKIFIYNGVLWLQSNDDLYRYETDSNKLTKVFLESVINDVAISEDYLWIATSKGLYKLQKDELIPTRLSERNYTALFYSSSQLLAKEGTAIVAPLDNKVLYRLKGENVNDVAEKLGFLWLATNTGLLKIERGKVIRRFLSGETIKDIEVNEQGLLVGTSVQLYQVYFDGINDPFFERIHSNKNDPLSFIGNHIYDISINNNGDIWIGTDFGLNFQSFISQKVKRLSSEKVYPDAGATVTSFFTHKNNIYLSSRNRMFLLNENLEVIKQKTFEHVITGALIHSGYLWITSTMGVSVHKIDTLEESQDFRDERLQGFDIQNVFSDSHSLWFSSGYYVMRYWPKSKTLINLYTDWSPFPQDVFLTDVIDVGDYGILLGTNQGLVRYFDGDFSEVSNEIGLGGVYSLTKDSSGSVWAFTSEGVYRNDDARTLDFNLVYEHPYDQSAQCLVDDEEGVLLISELGLKQFNTLNNRFIAKSISRHSLSKNGIYQNGCLLVDNNLVLAGEHGVFLSHKDNYFSQFDITKSDKIIGSIYVSGRPVRIGVNKNTHINVDHGDTVVVNIGNIPVTAKHSIEYLVSSKDDTKAYWHGLKGNRIVLSNISSGDYSLLLKVADGDGSAKVQTLLTISVVRTLIDNVLILSTLLGFISLILFVYSRFAIRSVKAQNTQLRSTVHKKVNLIDRHYSWMSKEGHKLDQVKLTFEDREISQTLPEDVDGDISEDQSYWAQLIIKHIDKHFHDPDFSSAQVAKVFNMSERNFQRRFKLMFNCRFSDLLLDTRLKMAKQMLCQGDKVTDVAIACGFKDPSYFTRLFKREVNVTPSDYKEVCTEK